MASVEELRANLAEYKSQHDAIVAALLTARGDPDLLKLKEEMKEVMDLTKELLRQKEEEQAAASAAASGVLVLKHTVGEEVEAQWSGDKEWYAAVVKSVDPIARTYFVTFTEYGTGETVHENAIRASQKQLEEVSRTVGTKRPREDSEPTELVPIPESLKITPEDSDEVRASKKKKIHRIKNRNRFAEMNKVTNEKKSSWQSFVGKKSKRKTGFMTTLKKESMFKSPDSVDGKVGVIGSGKGVTSIPERRPEYQKKKSLSLPE